MNRFQRIGLLASLDVPEVRESLLRAEQVLSAHGCQVFYEKQAAQLVGKALDQALDIDQFGDAIDLCVVVGGDGSMLGAGRKIAATGVPMLGLNRGTLGFLTDITPDEIEQRMVPVLKGNYSQSERFLLHAQVSRDGQPLGDGFAVNDVVVHPGESVRMMEFELYVDGEFVNSQRSDGLIVSTPTGSTAYALSAGGPILFPELDAIVVVPLNPHTLSNRPIVLSGSAEIEIRVGSRNELHPRVTCDGHQTVVSMPGDVIRVHKHSHSIKLIHPSDHNFYQICRSKLGWSSRLGNHQR